HLEFARGAERIMIDRWGLANMTKKKFTLPEWLQNSALVNLKRMSEEECEIEQGHTVFRYTGKLNLPGKLRALREARGSLRRFPSGYIGVIWEWEEKNRIFAVQVFHRRDSEDLWNEVFRRCVCH